MGVDGARRGRRAEEHGVRGSAQKAARVVEEVLGRCLLLLELVFREGNANDFKIGRPGYTVTKQYDPDTKQHSFLFEIDYPEIEENSKPRHRFMSSYEQKVESWDKRYQYLLFAAEPYETIAFKIPSIEIDKSTNKFFSYWDPDKKEYILQLYFKPRPPEASKPPPAPGTLPNGTGAPGAPPRPPGQIPPPPPQVPPPPPQAPPPAPMGMPPRMPPPPPPQVANGPPRPMIPPPPNFTPGAPPPRPPMQGFPGQQ
ncbi:hypothetical protein EJB05_07249, partial [Eragrostis curvula]